jgi:CRP/FNR family cyclic AMP-dependent transcriptional regulator
MEVRMMNGRKPRTIDLIMEHSPWLKLEQIDWSDITSGLEPKLYKKNASIYQQQNFSDYVYIVKSGRIRLSIYSHNGEEKHLIIADEGCIFGEISILDGLPNYANSTAIVDTYLYLIPKERFSEELNRNHDLCLRVMRVLARKIRLLTSQIEELSFDDAYYRVVDALVHLAEQYGIKTEKGCRIQLKFTHQEMADLTGSCRVTVTNIFRSLSDKKIIKKENGYVIVRDIDKLYRYLETKQHNACL